MNVYDNIKENCYMSYSGAGIKVLVDGKVFKSIKSIKYDSTKEDMEIELICVIMQDCLEELSYLNNIKNGHIEEVFGTEYDEYTSVCKKYNKVSFVGEKSSHHINTIIAEVTYVLSCCGAEPFVKVVEEGANNKDVASN